MHGKNVLSSEKSNESSDGSTRLAANPDDHIRSDRNPKSNKSSFRENFYSTTIISYVHGNAFCFYERNFRKQNIHQKENKANNVMEGDNYPQEALSEAPPKYFQVGIIAIYCNKKTL